MYLIGSFLIILSRLGFRTERKTYWQRIVDVLNIPENGVKYTHPLLCSRPFAPYVLVAFGILFIMMISCLSFESQYIRSQGSRVMDSILPRIEQCMQRLRKGPGYFDRLSRGPNFAILLEVFTEFSTIHEYPLHSVPTSVLLYVE